MVRGLQTRYGRDSLRALHLLNAEVRHTYPTHFAFLLQLGHRAPAFLDILVGVRPVYLIQVYDIRLESPQAVFTFLANRVCLEAVTYLPVFVPHQATLREHIRPVGAALQSTSHDLLGPSEPVHGRGVYPVDAQVNRAVDCGDRVLVVLRAPATSPVAATDGPRPEADRRDLHVRIAQWTCLHIPLHHPCSCSERQG